MADEIIKICWWVFCLYWLVSSFSVKPVAEWSAPSGRAAYGLPVLAGCLLLFWHRGDGPWHRAILPPNDVTPWIGCAFCVAGVLVCLWARWTLGGNWSSSVTFKKDHELIQRGPYRYVRHPIYTGLLTMILGTGIRNDDAASIAALALCTFGFWIKLRQEEALMLRHFPDQYPAYRERVKALVPFVV